MFTSHFRLRVVSSVTLAIAIGLLLSSASSLAFAQDEVRKARRVFPRLHSDKDRLPAVRPGDALATFALPDLAIGGVQFPPNKSKTVRITLLNKGQKASQPCQLLCEVQRIGKSKVARQKKFKVPPIAPRSKGMLIIHLDGILPESVHVSETRFKLMVDSQEIVTEKNEKNNVYLQAGVPQPDLRIVGFLFPTAGPSTAAEVKIANLGPASSGPCRLLLTVSEIEGVKVNRKMVVAAPKLNGVQAQVVTIDADSIVPSGVSLAATKFRLTIDATNLVEESNELNNNAYHNP